jgi:hypothetical protein
MILEDFKKGIDVILHPATTTKASMSAGDALRMYYRFSIIPLILAVMMALIASSLFSSMFSFLLGYGAVIAAIFAAAYVLVFIPIGIAIDAAIYHAVGKVLGIFKNGYRNTFTAVTFSSFLPLLLLWLLPIPIIGLLASLVSFWSIYVLSAALSNQQNTTKLKAFLVVLLSGIIIVVIVVLLVAFFALGIVGSTLGSSPQFSSCLPEAGFVCTGASFNPSTGSAAFALAQDTGVNWTYAAFQFVPAGISQPSFNSSSTYSVAAGLQSGQLVPVQLPVSVPSGGSTSGAIWARYQLNAGGAFYSKEVATATVQAFG